MLHSTSCHQSSTGCSTFDCSASKHNHNCIDAPSSFRVATPLPLGSHFPPPLTLQTTSCSIVPSPTSKHSEIHVWAFTIASTHHFASAMQSAHPSSNQQTQPQRALTTASTAMTPPLTTCCSPSKHNTLHSSSSISHSTTAISTGSPSSLTSVNTPPHRSTIPCRLDFRKIHYKAPLV